MGTGTEVGCYAATTLAVIVPVVLPWIILQGKGARESDSSVPHGSSRTATGSYIE